MLHHARRRLPDGYQVTKSVTRLLGADVSARRQHTLETIQTRLLTVNFFLEATRWPVEFVFDHKQKIFRRQLNYTRLQRLLEAQGVYLRLRDMVTIYRVRRAVPAVRPLITNKQKLRELRAQKLANQGLNGAQQQTRHVIHDTGTHTNTDISGERGGVSW